MESENLFSTLILEIKSNFTSSSESDCKVILTALLANNYLSSNPMPLFSPSESSEIISCLCQSSNKINLEDLSLTQMPRSFFPTNLIHGTSKSAYKSIRFKGLHKMQKNFIYFSSSLPEVKTSIEGSKAKNEVFIFLDLEKSSNFFEFFCLNSSIYFTKGKFGFVSPYFFNKVLINRIQRPLDFQPLAFDYYVVVDIDANCTDNGKLECQEIIEIPVVVINGKCLEVEFRFHRFVRPTVVPLLTGFCVEFTGIKQEMVDCAGDACQVIEEFDEFLSSCGILGKKWTFVACSDWDIGVCLKKEVEYKGIELRKYFYYWFSIKKLLPGFKKGDITEVCKYLGLDYEGRRHCGIDDCENTARCLKSLLEAKLLFIKEDLSGSVLDFEEFFKI